jgi:hypothetical protein
MSTFNLQVFTETGENAISSLYNSYYIASEGTATLLPFIGSPWNISKVTIPVPNYVSLFQVPLLLLKNDNLCEVALYKTNVSNGKIISYEVLGPLNRSFNYAIAIAENGITTSDKYGLQLLAPDGVNVLFDSRRTNNLIYKGVGGFGAGYFEEATIGVSKPFQYFSAPMHHHGVWAQAGGYIYSGLIFCKGTGTQSIYAVTYILVGQVPSSLPSGGGRASSMLFFDKAS